MNKLELYIDKNDRLTLDFYMNRNDDYPMAVFKGEKCYSVISKLCEDKILQIRDNPTTQEVSLIFKECILNISEYEQALRKKGTGPIKKSLSKYYEEEKQKTFKPKKVKRHNKHTGRKIIAGALVLTILGGVIGKEISDKTKKTEDLPQETTITQETQIPSETIYEPGKQEGVIGSVDLLKDVHFTDIKINNNDTNSIDVYIDFEDTSDTSKAKKTRAYYGSLIEKYSKMYGLNPEIVIAIATQERGIHSDKKDSGGATGLMQLQNSVWVGETITAYNYETNKREKLVINEYMLSDIFYNVKIGCMYFQNCMDYMDGNILAAIQCYNMGYGSMKTILRQYSKDTGKSVDEILNDVKDCGWLEYRSMRIGGKQIAGDPNYLENVLRWLGPNIEVNNLELNGNFINLSIKNENKVKNMSYN